MQREREPPNNKKSVHPTPIGNTQTAFYSSYDYFKPVLIIPQLEQAFNPQEVENFMKNQINITYKIPHMETIKATAELFHLSEHFVRCAVKGEHGHLFSVMAGTKYLVNCERFAAYLNCELTEQAQSEDKPVNGIRPIPVKL